MQEGQRDCLTLPLMLVMGSTERLTRGLPPGSTEAPLDFARPDQGHLLEFTGVAGTAGVVGPRGSLHRAS